MKQLLAIILMLINLSIYAQPNLNVRTDEIAQVNELENIVRQFNYTRNLEAKAINVEGSAYLDEQFVEGIVTLTNGASYHKIPLRLNVYNEEIEFRNPQGKIFNINNPASIRELVIGETKYIYTDVRTHHETQKVLAEVIEEGNVSLLKHHRIRLTEGRSEQTHRAAQPPRLVRMPSEYLIHYAVENTRPIKNEKELLLAIPAKREQVKELIDREKLSVKNEQDLVRIIRFLNQE